MFRFHSRGLFNGGGNYFVFVKQIAGIHDDDSGMGFTVLVKVSSFFVQPAELFARLRSTTRLGITEQIAAINYGKFCAVGCA